MFEGVPLSDGILLAVILAAFIIIGYKALSIIKNALIIAILAAVFPYVLNYFGFGFSTAYAAQIKYVLIALGLYLAYEILSLVLGIGGLFWSILKLIAKPFVWIGSFVKKLFGGKEKKDEDKNEEKKN